MASSKLPSLKTDFKQLAEKDMLSAKKIDSPFAKYNSIGQLSCIICNQYIKSELIWNAHLNSKSHIDNKNKLKSKLADELPSSISSKTITNNKQKQSNEIKDTTQNFKRPISNVSLTAEEISLLKKEDNTESDNVKTNKKQKLEILINQIDTVDLNNSNVISKIETKKAKSENDAVKYDKEEQKNVSNQDVNNINFLPEGFFDDPEQDAKIRGVSRAEKLDAEYEEFKKIIQTEEHKSDLIVEKDDVIRDVDRDLEEVEELITRWTNIENLHLKREELIASSKIKKLTDSNNYKNENKISDESEEESDLDIDNVLNLALRSKNRC